MLATTRATAATVARLFWPGYFQAVSARVFVAGYIFSSGYKSIAQDWDTCKANVLACNAQTVKEASF